MNKPRRQIDLKKIVLIGRTFDEYFRIFNLKDIEPEKEKILDAGSGVSSFTGEACAKGWDVTGSDRIYGIEPGKLEEKAQADVKTVIKELLPVRDKYRWDYYKDPAHLESVRKKALRFFISDYKRYDSKHYVYADYPVSPFRDKQFTMTLMSHFLFLYEDKLSYEFHREVIKELLRITSREIRIYPVTNHAGEMSGYLERLMHEDMFKQCRFDLRDHGFEFLIGAKEILVIENGLSNGVKYEEKKQ